MDSGNPYITLEINLSDRTVIQTTQSEELLIQYLGGIGINASYLFNNLSPATDPLGPENTLLFSAGILTGTLFPTSARTEASARSPMTNGFGTSNSGMHFGSSLKYAGISTLAIKGQASEPVCLLVEDGSANILPALDLWGRDAWTVIDLLKNRYCDAEIAVIGIAGENRVRFAAVENGYFDAWARSGLGAVMGSKNLKAIVVRGNKRLSFYDPVAFNTIIKEARQAIKASPFFKPFKAYGSMNAALPYGKFKALNAHNFTRGVLPDWKDNFDRSRVESFIVKHAACHACMIACGHRIEINEGRYKGLKVKDMEVTPVVSFGSGCGLGLEATVKASELCQRLGMDMVSTAGVIAMALEWYQKGLISRADVGYDIAFGNEESVLRLIDDIANRRNIGELLAEGCMRAGNALKGGSDAAMQIKGLEMPMIDPRGRWSTWTLGMLTNIRGGDHLRCRNPVENLRFNENLDGLRFERFGLERRVYDQLDMPESMKEKVFDLERDAVDIPLMSKWAEDLINMYNSAGVCIRPPVMTSIGPDIIARAVTALTGFTLTPEEAIKAGERSWNLMKLFNLRAGEKPEDSRFPRRFYTEPVAGKVLDKNSVDQILKTYYQARGWDENGFPTEGKLKELGIDYLRES
ncbi:MAG TPA: aldehyde ferredoxin oxidoreductase family protein [Syntrophomonadaceae bacterium]|nr:aldehyde ferredoxin oxidoreductase family protein [Syntrophomonadaceae bacterium]